MTAAKKKGAAAPAAAPNEKVRIELTRKQRNLDIVAAAKKAGVFPPKLPLCTVCASAHGIRRAERHRFMKAARAAVMAGQSFDAAALTAADALGKTP